MFLAMPASAEVGVGTSIMLPSEIRGVTEIMPAWNVRYYRPFDSDSGIEGVFSHSKAYGVEWQTLSAHYRYEASLFDLKGFAEFGPDLNVYNPVGLGKLYVGGAHLTVGQAMQLSQKIWLRTDMSFKVSPGFALLLNLGFSYRD